MQRRPGKKRERYGDHRDDAAFLLIAMVLCGVAALMYLAVFPPPTYTHYGR